jgi:hypothetical protein
VDHVSSPDSSSPVSPELPAGPTGAIGEPSRPTRSERILDALTDLVSATLVSLARAVLSVEGRLAAGASVPWLFQWVGRRIGLDADSGFFAAMSDLSYVLIGAAATRTIARTIKKVWPRAASRRKRASNASPRTRRGARVAEATVDRRARHSAPLMRVKP